MAKLNFTPTIGLLVYLRHSSNAAFNSLGTVHTVKANGEFSVEVFGALYAFGADGVEKNRPHLNRMRVMAEGEDAIKLSEENARLLERNRKINRLKEANFYNLSDEDLNTICALVE